MWIIQKVIKYRYPTLARIPLWPFTVTTSNPTLLPLSLTSSVQKPWMLTPVELIVSHTFWTSVVFPTPEQENRKKNTSFLNTLACNVLIKWLVSGGMLTLFLLKQEARVTVYENAWQQRVTRDFSLPFSLMSRVINENDILDNEMPCVFWSYAEVDDVDNEPEGHEASDAYERRE